MMTHLKQKKAFISILVMLLAVAVSISAFGFVATHAQETNRTYPSDIDNGQYDAFTDSDRHNQIEVATYCERYGKDISLTEENEVVHMKTQQDDAIALFVPRELFQTEGVSSYIGKEYGFITDTFAVEGSDALHTIVMLFDIIINDNSAATKDHLKIRIQPVFQGEFAYVTPQTEIIKCVKKNTSVKYSNEHQGNIEVDADGDYIVPVPTANVSNVSAVSQCTFSEVNKYYLKNFHSLVSLYNEHHLNEFDDGYQVSQDQGAYFIQTDFAYSGHFYEEGNVSFSDIGKIFVNTVSIGLDTIRLLKLIPANPLISLVGNVADFVKSCMNLAVSAMEQMQPTEKGLTYTPDFTTAEEQIANKGYLTKDSLISVVSNNNEDFILTTGDYIETDYQISISNPGWETRYVTALVMDATTLTDNGFESFTISNVGYSDTYDFAVISERIDANAGEDVDVYLLPNGKQKQYLDIEHTGWYTFFFDAEGKFYNRIADVSDVLNEQEIETIYDENTNSYRAYLHAGKTYTWEIGYLVAQIGGRQTCRYIFDPQKIVVGDTVIPFNNQTSEYIQLKFDDYYFYKLSCAKSGATLHLYDDKMNEIQSGTSLRVENGGGKATYVSVSFAEPITENISIHCDKERDILFKTYAEEEIEPHTIIDDAYCELPVPSERIGYTFAGWWGNEFFEGNPVTGNTLSSINQASITLHANWLYVKYDIIYEENGGDPIADSQYTINDFVRLNDDIHRKGYLFKGWYDNEDLTGTSITQIDQGSTGNRIYYAKWVKEQYKVSFNENNDFIDEQNADLFLNNTEYTQSDFTVNYGQEYKLPIAQTKGFIFEGWYYGDTQITDANGNSVATYTYEDDIGLLAKWTRESYKIKLVVDDEHTYWLINSGISVDEATIDYISGLCPNCMIQALRNASPEGEKPLFRSGYIYNCLTTVPGDGTKLACWHEYKQDLVNGAEYTIYVLYDLEQYQIYFEGVEDEKNDYAFNDIIEYPKFEVKEGYSFNGWLYNDKKCDWIEVPDLTPDSEGNGSVTLKPDIQIIDYKVEYDLGAGTFKPGEEAIKQYNVETETFNLLIPQYANHRFMGWYDNQEFTGEVITQVAKGTTGDKAFYAKWAKEYTVTLIYGTQKEEYKVIDGQEITLPSRAQVDSSNDFYYYDGTWAITVNAEITKRLNIDKVQSYVFDLENDATITLSWAGKYYAIEYVYGFGATFYDGYYQYGKDLTLRDPYVHSLNRFLGYYTDVNFSNEISVISSNQHGTVTLYVKWDYHVGGFFGGGGQVITDDGYMEQYYDSVLVGIPDPDELGFDGFNWIVFEFQFSIREIDDGYQKICLMDENNNIIWEEEIEHGPGYKDTSTITYTKEIKIKLENWNSENYSFYYFRYNARGAFEDDWVIDNTELNVYLTIN